MRPVWCSMRPRTGLATVELMTKAISLDAAALDAQLDCARLILDAAQRAGDTDTHASLYAVERSGEQTTPIFLQMYSGAPVLGDADFCNLRIFDGSALRTANDLAAEISADRR